MNTGKGDPGWEDDGENDEQAYKATDKELGHVAGTNIAIDGAIVCWVLSITVQAVNVKQYSGDVEGELLSSGPKCRWAQDLEAGLAVRDSLVPFLAARVADDDVGPSHVDAGKKGMKDDGEQGTSHKGGVSADADVVEKGVKELVQNRETEAAET